MRRLALSLSLLALGTLGMSACAGDDQSTVVSEREAGPARAIAEANPPVEDLVRIAEKWAALYGAAPNPDACAGWDERHPDREVAAKYMGQPACERTICVRAGNRPIKNCTPPSAEFQRSFADATVRELVIERHRAGVRFSNGVAVEFAGPGQYQLPAWVVDEIGRKAGSEFFHQPPTPDDEREIAALGDEWAPLFAKDHLKACRFMRWVACEDSYDYEAGFEPPDGDPSGFQRSFAGATVERVVFEDPDADPVVASAEFSNGESVELLPSVEGVEWLITNLGDNLGRERLSDRERLANVGNGWARLFANPGDASCRHMGQPACERMGCERVGNRPIKNCTPPSAEYRESFAGATVEWVAFAGRRATAMFSNGESVALEGVGDWYVTEDWVKRVARRNLLP